ncbi:hypothetical protein SAMN05444358_1011243 [Ruegeria halocynthiae]|uniref:Uncharacterized protein n=1 Tax=Ruegeria halocynthiae TaxID=985054 RepID=A0A1H2UUM4_9RHOB|nr:hypothetical protein [Ruegeria halocynthiae]SDW59284.1 hypothetical protein SAMN05444358_1011243 [Ruegeria halocynthiae]
MSDRVVNANIQDVLSSVKRMVDEDAHDESEFIFVPSAPAPKPGRLVLTDALRVSDEPLTVKKATPLRLMPQHSAGASTLEQAANAPSTPAEPMRLQPGDIVQADDAKAEAPKRDLAGSLSAKIEALEAAIARTEDQWEPDGESDDEYSGTKTQAVEWPVEKSSVQSQATKAEPESRVEPEATFIRDPAVMADQAQKVADVTIEEEELRELVAQIVREELQGALGERITRNLRKMVRREITRAVAASDID